MTRLTDDAYMTPDDLALEITARVGGLITTPQTVLEPSAGEGSFVRAVAQVWPGTTIHAVEPRNVVAGALQPARVWQTTTEAFANEELAPGTPPRLPHYDLVIGNPPYKLAEKHVTLARSLGTYVAFLLRMSFLSSQERAKRVWAQPGLRWLMPLAQRPSFTGKGTDNSEYAVYVWKAGYTGLAEITPHVWVWKS